MGLFDKILPKEINPGLTLINPSAGVQDALLGSSGKKKTKTPTAWGGASSTEMLPMVPSLLPYEGYSNKYNVAVSLTPGEQAAETLATNLITGKEGSFKQQLSGEPNYAQVNQLIGIQQRDFDQQVMPDIRRSAKSGPYGNTGLAKRMEADARLSQSDQEAAMRFDAYQMAKQEALQAAQLLPSLTGVAGLTRNNEINNILRDMEVHYKNQGLSVQQFQMDAQRFANELALSQFEYQQWADMENLRMQREAAANAERASTFGMVGGLLGAGLGSLAGPGGMMLGASLGTGIGYGVGGDRMSGMQQFGSALNTFGSASIYGNANPQYNLWSWKTQKEGSK